MPETIPVEFIFNPNWWFRNYGISFRKPFYLDPQTRIENDAYMQRALYLRFGLGRPHPQPRPVLGSLFVAGGFVIPALLGAKIRFSDAEAPLPAPLNLTAEEVMALKPSDLENTWPMDCLIEQARDLQQRYGYAVGDLNTDGVLNVATLLRGNELFTDFYDNPELAHHLFGVIAETIARVACFLRSVTGTCSIAVNRSIVNVDPGIFLHANCSLQMISPDLYREHLLPYEIKLAERLGPFGIHHCGSNLQLFAEAYAKTGGVFYDVGWGSDAVATRAQVKDAFLNLRLSPIRMLQESAQTIRSDVENLLCQAGSTDNIGLCCINMDYDTPDENVRTVIDVAREWGRRGGK